MESLCYVQVVTPDFMKYNLAWYKLLQFIMLAGCNWLNVVVPLVKTTSRYLQQILS